MLQFDILSYINLYYSSITLFLTLALHYFRFEIRIIILFMNIVICYICCFIKFVNFFHYFFLFYAKLYYYYLKIYFLFYFILFFISFLLYNVSVIYCIWKMRNLLLFHVLWPLIVLFLVDEWFYHIFLWSWQKSFISIFFHISQLL